MLFLLCWYVTVDQGRYEYWRSASRDTPSVRINAMAVYATYLPQCSVQKIRSDIAMNEEVNPDRMLTHQKYDRRS